MAGELAQGTVIKVNLPGPELAHVSPGYSGCVRAGNSPPSPITVGIRRARPQQSGQGGSGKRTLDTIPIK